MPGHKGQIQSIILKDENNTKLHIDNEKETAYRTRLESIFRINDQYNDDFDLDMDQTVGNYLEHHINEIIPQPETKERDDRFLPPQQK